MSKFANCASLPLEKKIKKCSLCVHMVQYDRHRFYTEFSVVLFNYLVCIYVQVIRSSWLIRLCGTTFFDLYNHVAWVRFQNIIIFNWNYTNTHTRMTAPLSNYQYEGMKTHKFIHLFHYLSPFCSFYLIFYFLPLSFLLCLADNLTATYFVFICIFIYISSTSLSLNKNKIIWYSKLNKKNVYRKSLLS